MNMTVRELFHFIVHLHLASCSDHWLRECIHTSLIPKPIQNVKDEPETDPSLSNDCPFILELEKDNSLFLISYFQWTNSLDMWSDWHIRRAWRSGLAYFNNNVPPYFCKNDSGSPSSILQFAALTQSSLGHSYEIDISSDDCHKHMVIKSDDSISFLFYDNLDLLIASKFPNSDYGFCISNNHNSDDFVFRVATGITENDSLDFPHVMRAKTLVRPEETPWSMSTRLCDRRIHTVLRSNTPMLSSDYNNGPCDGNSSMMSNWISMLPPEFQQSLGDVLQTDSLFFYSA